MTDHNAHEIEQIRQELSRLETALEQSADWRSLRRIEGILSDADNAGSHYWESECNRLRGVLATNADYCRSLDLRRILSDLAKTPKKTTAATTDTATNAIDTSTLQSTSDAPSVPASGASDIVAAAARAIAEAALDRPLDSANAPSRKAAQPMTSPKPNVDQQAAQESTPTQEALPLVAELLTRNTSIDNTRVKIHAHPPGAKRARQQPTGAPDDLTRIRSIDRQLCQRLIELGVTRFDEIANWSAQDVRSISAALGLERKISRQNWIEQAALLVLKAEKDSAGTTMPETSPQPVSSPREAPVLKVATPQPRLATTETDPPPSNTADPSAMVSNALGWPWSQACLQGDDAPVRVDPPSVLAGEGPVPPAEPEERADAVSTPPTPDDMVSRTAAAIALSLASPQTTNFEDVDDLVEDADPGDAVSISVSQNAADEEPLHQTVVHTASSPCIAHELEEVAHSQPEKTAAEAHDSSAQVATDEPLEDELPDVDAGRSPVSVQTGSGEAAQINDAADTGTVTGADAAKIEEEIPSAPDDLQLISVIDKRLADRLVELGVRRFAQIADWNIHDMAKVAINLRLGSRPWREGWVEQASILANGGRTQYAMRAERGDQRALIPPPEADQTVDPGFAAWLRETAEAPVKPQPPRHRPAAAPQRPRIADVLGETIAVRQRRQHSAPLVPPPIPQPEQQHRTPPAPAAHARVVQPEHEPPIQRVPVNPDTDGIEVSDEPTEPSQAGDDDGSMESPPAAFDVAEAEVLIVPRTRSESDGDGGSGNEADPTTDAKSPPAAESDSTDDFPGSTVLPNGELRRRKNNLNDPFKPRTAADAAYAGHNGQALDDVDPAADQTGFEVEEASVQIISDEPPATSSTTQRSPADRSDGADH